MTSQIQKHQTARRVDELIKLHALSLCSSQELFWKLIHVIRARTGLLACRSGAYFTKRDDVERVLSCCIKMIRYQYAWRRSPESWNIPEASPFVQMRSLVQHLFDEYPVPKFMASIWWSEQIAAWEMGLYLHLAAGRSIRQFSPLHPFRITKRMVAFYFQAPDDIHPMAALRWAQVRSMGGDDRLARLLVTRTILCAPTEHEDFWESVIHYLIKNAPLSTEEVLGIIMFIYQQRFEPAERIWGWGAGQEPVQPDFSIRGRTLMSLRRHMANWRFELIEKGLAPASPVPMLDSPWERSGIDSFRLEQDGVEWSIEELLTSRELRVEGGIMQHCVATYIPLCARRRTTIWSMKIQQEGQRKRALTIEVLPESKRIIQARGKQNAAPSKTARDILNLWATQEGLKFREQV